MRDNPVLRYCKDQALALLLAADLLDGDLDLRSGFVSGLPFFAVAGFCGSV
jgi:hypothetical protein